MMSRDDIETKLLDYFLGELDEKEENEILQRVETDEEFRKLFYHVCSRHLGVRWGTRVELVKGEVSRVKHLIRQRRVLRMVMKVAAICVLLLSIGGILWVRSDKEVDEIALNDDDVQITPGKPEALLYLSSGERVLLSKMKKELREDNGVAILVNDDGEVRYHAERQDSTVQPLLNRLVVPRGAEFMISLEDGTRVWLDSETELGYPTNFNAGERVVYVRGEAYFDVVKMKDKPFIVKVEQMSVNVLGTKFNISTRVENIVQTVLVEGKVSLESKDKQVVLRPNQKADFDSGSEDWTIENVDVSSYVAWKDGNFVFDNKSLEYIMNKLSLWYDVDVRYSDERVKSVKLSGDMKRYKNIQELLYFFERISDVRFVIKGKQITVGYK